MEYSEYYNKLRLDKYYAKNDETIEKHTNELKNRLIELEKLGYIKDEELFTLIERAVMHHDIGKINNNFQERLRNNSKFKDTIEVGHNIISYFLLDIVQEDDDMIVANAVLNHHYHNDDNYNYVGAKKDLIKINLEKINKEFKLETDEKSFSKKFRIKRQKLDKVSEYTRASTLNNKLRPVIVLGLLNKLDYSASAHIPIEYSSDNLLPSLDNMMERWKARNSKTNWNDLQHYCSRHREDNIIITASTGMGKTEAALKWIGNTKGFFVLPLKAAINAIYYRVRDEVFQNDNIETKVGLLHSDGINIYRESHDESYDLTSYYDHTKKFCLPLTITTPDQIFDFVFKANGFEYKLAMMSYSKIVIDEIQSYSADILASIIYAIQLTIFSGGKVGIFTATLPPFIKDLLDIGTDDEILEDISFKCKSFTNSSNRHHVKVKQKELEAEDIIEHYKASSETSKKYLVVCNTVKKAQEIFEKLKECGLENTKLIHSKFTKKDRSEKEYEILETGKTFNEDGSLYEKNEIWISTQIVEASLDIDFDVLFTELSDLNGLFQRMGRVNRKGKKDISKPNCYVFTEINKKILKVGASNQGFIDDGIYSLSKDAVVGFGNGTISELDKQMLIDEYLTTEKLEKKESGFLKDYNYCYNVLAESYPGSAKKKDVDKRFRNIISFNAIPVDVDNGIYANDIIMELINKSNSIKEKLKISDNPINKRKEMLDTLSRINSEIMRYTVPVGLYDLGIYNSNVKEIIEISKYQKIYLVYCHYNSELGFKRLNKEDREKYELKGKDEESFDNFI